MSIIKLNMRNCWKIINLS